MTKVVFFKSNGVFWGFEEQGHTGFADSGEDIVCSALSAMTMLVINAIEVAYASEADYDIDDETTNVRLIARGALPNYESDEKKRYAISGLIMAYYYQLNDLVEEYYDYLEVEVIEKEYKGNK
ncbi:MAG: ribosomal-processing cysteine protease Prp [Clostridia bacterium]|nr:ribosomal-processing cysteine protease Prp [Clostridia bacterium]MBR2944077.1 ribosomal-processing cysteine protease Prp [Clostridia bacterium]